MKYFREILLFLIPLVVAFATVPVHAQVNATTVTVTPNTVVVWEAQSYTPPFYKGKALFPDGGVIRLIAFPPLSLGEPTSFDYVWEVNGVVDGDASGIGRNSYTYRSDIFGGSPLIVVTIKDGGKEVGVGALRLPLSTPRALLYADLPLAGIIFGNYTNTVSGEEVALEAYPLYFSAKSTSAPSLSYRWSVDGSYAENPLGNTGRLVLRSETAGTSTVGVSISNAGYGLEVASGQMNVILEN